MLSVEIRYFSTTSYHYPRVPLSTDWRGRAGHAASEMMQTCSGEPEDMLTSLLSASQHSVRKSFLSSFLRGGEGMSYRMHLGNLSLGRRPGVARGWTGSKSHEQRTRLAHASTTGDLRPALVHGRSASTECSASLSMRCLNTCVGCRVWERIWLRSTSFLRWRWIGGIPARVSAAPFGLVLKEPMIQRHSGICSKTLEHCRTIFKILV